MDWALVGNLQQFLTVGIGDVTLNEQPTLHLV
jgi:hypothetical protein